MRFDYLIIGGGIAGVTAAETIREHDAGASIAIVSDEPHVLYSRVLLPGYLKNRFSRENLFLRKHENFTRLRIDLFFSEKVIGIDVKHREVVLDTSKAFSFERLLITSGGSVREWGTDEDQRVVYRLQTLDDADRLYAGLRTMQRPLVVGASFISLEFLEILVVNKLSPVLMVRDERFFGNLLDKTGGDFLEDNFRRKGITSHYGDAVEGIALSAGGVKITARSHKEMECDAICVGVGIDRNTSFVENSGIEIGEGKGIRVNQFMETSEQGIFAAGDVAEYFDVITGKHRMVGNWTNAVLQGKCAGINMVGEKMAAEKKEFRSVPSYSITNLGFQITALGDTHSDKDTIVRYDPAARTYERLFLEDGVLAGAVLINRFADKAHVAGLVEHKINVAHLRDNLQDSAFDIHSISMVG